MIEGKNMNKGKIVGIISLKGGNENQRFSGLLLNLEVYENG